MAYTRYSRARGSRSAPRSRYGSRSTSRSYPKRKATRRAPAQQTVKLVIEHTGLSTIARPEAHGLKETRANKAKY